MLIKGTNQQICVYSCLAIVCMYNSLQNLLSLVTWFGTFFMATRKLRKSQPSCNHCSKPIAFTQTKHHHFILRNRVGSLYFSNNPIFSCLNCS